MRHEPDRERNLRAWLITTAALKGTALGAAPFRETQRYAVNASGRASRS
jgi:hypothetical protein